MITFYMRDNVGIHNLGSVDTTRSPITYSAEIDGILNATKIGKEAFNPRNLTHWAALQAIYPPTGSRLWVTSS